MPTLAATARATMPPGPPPRLPPLEPGEHLDQPTFHARYAAMPPGTRAELVGGVVRFPPPRVTASEGAARAALAGWLGRYEAQTPGTAGMLHVTTFLGPDSEVEPSSALRICSGGRSRVTADDYLDGCPELVCEVAVGPGRLELGEKLTDYDRYGGGREYLVVLVRVAPTVRWFGRGPDGRLAEVPPDADGWYRSAAFPGLWLDPAALLAGDTRRVLDALTTGLATPDHTAFATGLAGRVT